MKIIAFIVAATVFEAVGDALMRIALHYHVLPGRLALFVGASMLLTLYGVSLNLAPVEFAEATGIYIASLFVMFQVVNYMFFKVAPSFSVLTGGAFIVMSTCKEIGIQPTLLFHKIIVFECVGQRTLHTADEQEIVPIAVMKRNRALGNTQLRRIPLQFVDDVPVCTILKKRAASPTFWRARARPKAASSLSAPR